MVSNMKFLTISEFKKPVEITNVAIFLISDDFFNDELDFSTFS